MKPITSTEELITDLKQHGLDPTPWVEMMIELQAIPRNHAIAIAEMLQAIHFIYATLHPRHRANVLEAISQFEKMLENWKEWKK